MGDLITAEELAERLRLRPSTIRRWSQDGLIPSIKLTGRVTRFDFDAVRAALTHRSAPRRGQTLLTGVAT